MNQKYFLLSSCLAVFCVATINMVFAKNSQSLITANQVNSNKSFTSINRVERAINSRQRHREGNNNSRRISSEKYSSTSYQKQQTAVNLSSSDLRHTNFLSISTSPPETQLTATVSINGKRIKSFTDDDVFDLSPYLTLGEQIVSISGSYTPGDASVKIEFKSKTTQVSQETRGSGELEQQLIFYVK